MFTRNGGVATVGELKTLGFTEAQIRRLVRQGVLIPVRRGIYAPAKLAAVRESARKQALHLAAVLAGTDADAAGSHWTAAVIHGLDLLERSPEDVVALTQAPGGGSRAQRRGIHLHAADLPSGHVVRRHGVPVTSVARTVVDLARTRTFREGVIVADSALRSDKATLGELRSIEAACEQWPGIQQARRVVDFADGRAESVLESLARVIMHENGLPAPELQVWIQDGYGARIGRVDFFWPRYNTIGEADGAMKYEDSAAVRKQLERDKKLRQAGYELVHFGWQGIVYDTKIVIREFLAAFDRGRVDT